MREERTGRRRGGKTLQVHVDSLPADLREAGYLERGVVLHEKPDAETGQQVMLPEQAYQNDAKFEADLELARWRHEVIRPLLALEKAVGRIRSDGPRARPWLSDCAPVSRRSGRSPK
ncbi:hypothetical protein [Phaeobacter porticola]|uniref:hypothetical protein n=1 Tax=Phaeobacter porticola TaxID=1844006 RepID=UPI000930E086|nr:hypothetical protein [Phaeobacter porticola]